MVDLGACNKCGKDNCDKYVSEDPNSYTDCQYCGCGANHHEGADALRRPQQQPSVGGGGGVVPITSVFPQSQNPASIQPRVSLLTGKPQQTSAFGGCSMPGCPYPKRIDGDRVHDYCSRTCAQKHRNMQASFHQQKAAAAHQAAGMPSSSSSPSQHRVMVHAQERTLITQRPGQPPTATTSTVIMAAKLPGQPPDTKTPIDGSPPMGAPPTGTGQALCKQCKMRYANPGRGWCQQCYLGSQS